MAITDQIKEELYSTLKSNGINIEKKDIVLSIPPVKEHGDYSTNIVLKTAKKAGFVPLDLATKIAGEMKVEGVTKIQAVKPGFLNFFVSQENMTDVIKQVLAEGVYFGSPKLTNGIKVNIEYVSANPTGYLHLGHARGAAVGDSMARIMKKAGYLVTREYYINDAGNQIDHMAASLIARYLQRLGHKDAQVPDEGYHGEDIVNIAEQLYREVGNKYEKNTDENFEFFKEYGTKKLLDKIKSDLKHFRVEFDVFTSEKAIRKSGLIEKVLEKLQPYTFKKDNAVFLKTTQDGDDKDRVIIKKDGSYTYFLPDIAYHYNKFQRGFDQLIDVFGADHAGYIARLKSAMHSLGEDPDKLYVAMVQIVRLFKNGEEFRMSKRTGNAIAMNDLVNEVGIDSVRYFFVSRAGDSHLDFDLDLAKSLSTSNPVYYAQYTHARLASVIDRGKEYYTGNYDSSLLNNESELAIMKILKEYPLRVSEAAKTYQPYKICMFVQALSTAVNEWYQKVHFIVPENPELTESRLALAKACQIVLKDALSLIGVAAPYRM